MKKILNIWVVGGSILVALALTGVFWAGMVYYRNSMPAGNNPIAVVTVIPAPTLTPVVITPTAAPTATEEAPQIIPPANTGISPGLHVQVVGTGGDGLRLRSEPGTNGSIKFLGLDSEVFLVKDGPVEKDGFTWWYLTTPVDEKRGGWAVSNYLAVIQVP